MISGQLSIPQGEPLTHYQAETERKCRPILWENTGSGWLKQRTGASRFQKPIDDHYEYN